MFFVFSRETFIFVYAYVYLSLEQASTIFSEQKKTVKRIISIISVIAYDAHLTTLYTYKHQQQVI